MSVMVDNSVLPSIKDVLDAECRSGNSIFKLADKLENKKIFPKIVYKKYDNNEYGDIDIIYKHECEILFSKIKDKKFNLNDEYYFDEEDITKYSYTYYYNGTDNYYSDYNLIKQYNDNSIIPFAIYYKDNLCLPKELSNIKLEKPLKLKGLNINPDGRYIYSLFKEEYYNIIDDTIIQYKNIPISEYNRILQPFNQFNYIVNSGEWGSTTKTPEYTLKMMKEFLENGFIIPIMLLHYDGKYYPISCNTKVITAKLFNMPYIPSIILYSNENYDIIKTMI